MYYLDTNIILSYNYRTEEDHLEAFNLIERIKDPNGNFYISTFSILELYCVISRNIDKYKLPPFSQFRSKTEEDKINFIIQYAINKLKLKICPENITSKEIKTLNVSVFLEYYNAIKLAPNIKLTASDTLHIAYACRLKKEGAITHIVSFDTDFQKKKGQIEDETGIKIISI
jgi:predicted nucleic acid-binding protein